MGRTATSDDHARIELLHEPKALLGRAERVGERRVPARNGVLRRRGDKLLENALFPVLRRKGRIIAAGAMIGAQPPPDQFGLLEDGGVRKKILDRQDDREPSAQLRQALNGQQGMAA